MTTHNTGPTECRELIRHVWSSRASPAPHPPLLEEPRHGQASCGRWAESRGSQLTLISYMVCKKFLLRVFYFFDGVSFEAQKVLILMTSNLSFCCCCFWCVLRSLSPDLSSQRIASPALAHRQPATPHRLPALGRGFHVCPPPRMGYARPAAPHTKQLLDACWLSERPLSSPSGIPRSWGVGSPQPPKTWPGMRTALRDGRRHLRAKWGVPGAICMLDAVQKERKTNQLLLGLPRGPPLTRKKASSWNPRPREQLRPPRVTRARREGMSGAVQAHAPHTSRAFSPPANGPHRGTHGPTGVTTEPRASTRGVGEASRSLWPQTKRLTMKRPSRSSPLVPFCLKMEYRITKRREIQFCEKTSWFHYKVCVHQSNSGKETETE